MCILLYRGCIFGVRQVKEEKKKERKKENIIGRRNEKKKINIKKNKSYKIGKRKNTQVGSQEKEKKKVNHASGTEVMMVRIIRIIGTYHFLFVTCNQRKDFPPRSMDGLRSKLVAGRQVR